MDNDGRMSPFHSADAGSKYNGNAAMVSPPTSHSPQELQSGGPQVLSTYAVPQQKQGSSTANSTHVGVPGNFAPYGISMPNYNSSSATAAVTSTSNVDHAARQVKENKIYNEGSGVWFTTPSRDISSLQASSYYNLPQGQLAFTPTQPVHRTFPGLFHPAQAVTAAAVHPLLQHSQSITSPADVTGPAATVYQQPQHHQQLNWPGNY